MDERTHSGPFRIFRRSSTLSFAAKRGRGGMADAAVLNTAGATRAGSNPAVRTPKNSRISRTFPVRPEPRVEGPSFPYPLFDPRVVKKCDADSDTGFETEAHA